MGDESLQGGLPFVETYVCRVTIVEQLLNGRNIGSAIGFFYERAGQLFLVTNTHVFQDFTKKCFPDSFRLTLHKKESQKGSGTFTFPIMDMESWQPCWMTHPKLGHADVAILPLDRRPIEEHFRIEGFSHEDLLHPGLMLWPGEDVFAMGYPHGYYDDPFNLPIFRSAMIASSYGVPFRGSPRFLVDANLHEGASGSPVITKPKNVWVTLDGSARMTSGVGSYLVGIFSGWGDIDALDLGVLVYRHLAG